MFGDTGDNKERVVSGFSDKSREHDHAKRHAAVLGVSEKEYHRFAKEFLEKLMTKNMEEMTVNLPGGYRKIYRYDYANKIVGVIGTYGECSTCYRYEWDE